MKMSTKNNYYAPTGGLPPQTQLLSDRAIFTEAYAFIPKRVLTDIVVSFLPFWQGMRMWVIARPLSGFSETFSQYIVEVAPQGGSDRPELDAAAEAVLFIVEGQMDLVIEDSTHHLVEGGYAYLPPGCKWTLRNNGNSDLKFHWIRKAYQYVDGLDAPDAFVTNDNDVEAKVMPDTNEVWKATLFTDQTDMRHDMNVNIVTFQPGGVIPFDETHVMEHGIYVLEGKAVYHLNGEWVEVEAGDFMWLRAFCPQSCYAGGPSQFRYLLYKDINRHMPFIRPKN
jgi:(S)-ureidoglycine aminohydrolase